MFGNLPDYEKQAFFGLLDEYFTARPHLLGNPDETTPSNSYAQSSASPPPPTPRRNNPPAPAARKPAVVPPTPVAATYAPAPSYAARSSGPAIPAGLNFGKSIGSIKTSSAGAAFGSMIKSNNNSKDPITPGEAVSGLRALNSAANRMNLGGQQQARAAPPPPPPPPPSAAVAAPSLGQAEVLYDYNGTEADDLIARKFEIVDLVEKVNGDWWKAEASDGSGRSGLIPANYIKLI